MRLVLCWSVAALIASLSASAPGTISAQAAQDHPPAAFADPNRRAKLATAFPDIDQAVGEFMTRARVPGAAWGIVIDGQLAHIGVAGYRDLATKAPVTRDSVFRIASMSKSFAAMSILALRDQGKLSLDDLVETHVPELKNLRYPTTDSPRIRVRDLLSHAAGFPEDNPWGDQQLDVTEDALSRMMSQGIPFSNPPGVVYEYSNYGFAILGRIVTNVSGKPYRQFLNDTILKPLGMTSTTLEPSAVPANRMALGYRWEDEQWKLEPALPDGAFGVMGGMLTSIADLTTYVGALLAAFPARDGAETAPIRRSSLREMQQIWRSRPAVVTRSGAGGTSLNSGGYGYGLGLTQSCEFDHIVAHSGGLPGYGSMMRWLPSYGVGVIAFGNVTYTGWGSVVTQAFDLMAKTGGLQPRTLQPSAALVAARTAVSELIMNWDNRRADEIAAVNLFLDSSKARRQRQIADLREKVGTCSAPTSFDTVENWLRGQWTMSCERGGLQVAITLAPTTPPKVQYLDVSPAEPVPARATCR